MFSDEKDLVMTIPRCPRPSRNFQKALVTKIVYYATINNAKINKQITLFFGAHTTNAGHESTGKTI